MNVVYISEVYLNFTPGAKPHQVFVVVKPEIKAKALNQQKLGLRIEAKQNTTDLLIALSQ